MWTTEAKIYTSLFVIFFFFAIVTTTVDPNAPLVLFLVLLSCFLSGALTSSVACRKGYLDYKVYPFSLGFFFPVLGFLYYAFIPPAWEHPEYINADSKYDDDDE